jgi:cytochrome c2
MRKLLICLALGGVTGVLWLGRPAPQANADRAFRDEFKAVYVKAESDNPKEKEFAATVKKANCNICHVGKVKKNRNRYGKALAELLSRKTDTEDKEKIQAALKKVDARRCEPKDEKSPTFGELIRAGKLPGEAPKTSESHASLQGATVR